MCDSALPLPHRLYPEPRGQAALAFPRGHLRHFYDLNQCQSQGQGVEEAIDKRLHLPLVRVRCQQPRV